MFSKKYFREKFNNHWLFGSKNIIDREQRDFLTGRKVITVFSCFHFTLYSVYLIIVLIGYGPNFIYGFKNIQQLPQNNFVDYRYSFLWVIIFINLGRIILYVSYQLRTQFENYNFLNRKIFSTLVTIYIIFDIFYFITLLFYNWTCNSSWLIINPCNDNIKNYCSAFGNLYPTECKMEYYTALPYYELKSNIYFTIDFWFILVFFIFDVIQYYYEISYHASFIKATQSVERTMIIRNDEEDDGMS